MTSHEFFTTSDERERTEDYLFNLGRLDDMIRWKRNSIIDGADYTIERLRALDLSETEDYDIASQSHLDNAVACQIEKIIAFTTQATDDLNRFIHEQPRQFRITQIDTQESEILRGLLTIGRDEEIRVAAQTETGEVDLSHGDYVLHVSSQS